MYTKIYDAIAYATDCVGIIGIAVTGLFLWCFISVLCEKKPKKEKPVYKDDIPDFFD